MKKRGGRCSDSPSATDRKHKGEERRAHHSVPKEHGMTSSPMNGGGGGGGMKRSGQLVNKKYRKAAFLRKY